MLAVLAAHVRLDVVVVLLAVDQVVGAVGRRIVDGLFAFALAFSRAKRRIVVEVQVFDPAIHHGRERNKQAFKKVAVGLSFSSG